MWITPVTDYWSALCTILFKLSLIDNIQSVYNVMKKIIILLTIAVLIMCGGRLEARSLNFGLGIYGGFMPAMGGNLHSNLQENSLDSSSGIDGINRGADGKSTSNVERLVGISAGAALRTIINNYILLRLGINYTNSMYGGEGDSLYTPDGTSFYVMSCSYSLQIIDVPFTVGISIPFWKDMKISLSGGAAYARGTYENGFESTETGEEFKRKGKFKGTGYPLVFIVEGEYFITETIALTSAIAYYRGSTRLIEDSSTSSDSTSTGTIADSDVVDFARIDFTGYRFTIGISKFLDPI